jgi:hypothetical protein
MSGSHENLKTIWFEGEMLPNWAQLLDAAARFCPVSEEIRGWFSRLTNSTGVDDSRTVIAHAGPLQRALRENQTAVISQLQRTRGDGQAAQIFAAWDYALETMMQQATGKQTCSWTVEGIEDTGEGGFGGGDITLRRV